MIIVITVKQKTADINQDWGNQLDGTVRYGEVNRMSDLIDRKQAIDAIVNRTVTVDTDAQWLSGHARCELEIIDIINALPSAQPDVPDTNVGDMISRQAAIDALHAHLMYRMGTESNKKRLDEWINSLPSAQPERKAGEWTDDNACPFCGFQPWYERDIHTLSFCPNCGADMRGEQE